MGDYICTFFLGDCTVRLGVKWLEGTRRGDLRSSIVRDGVFFYACFGWGFCFCVSFLIIFECRDLVGGLLGTYRRGGLDTGGWVLDRVNGFIVAGIFFIKAKQTLPRHNSDVWLVERRLRYIFHVLHESKR